MANVFTNVLVYPRILGKSFIQWDLHPAFSEAGPYTFFVQWSHSGVNLLDGDPASDWKTITSTSNYSYTDPTQHLWSHSDRVFYRIKLTTALNTYYSDPVRTLGNISDRDRLIVRDVLRKETLFYTRYVGSCGLLFKRRTWGLLCPNKCYDYDTGAVINQACPVCFGTGFNGGYFPGLDYRVMIQQVGANKISRDVNVGMQDQQQQIVRALACPVPRTNDFWLDLSDDSRWIIQTITYPIVVRGVPIILQMELKQCPPTDVIQTIDRYYKGIP